MTDYEVMLVQAAQPCQCALLRSHRIEFEGEPRGLKWRWIPKRGRGGRNPKYQRHCPPCAARWLLAQFRGTNNPGVSA